MKRPITNDRAFTLIELMIVIAILSLLISLAIPAYQNYTTRTSNAECMSIANSIKVAVSESAHSNGVTVDTVQLNQTGIEPEDTATSRCSNVDIVDGRIIISSLSTGGGSDGEFQFIPHQPSIASTIEWSCESDHSVRRHVPPSCR